MRNFLVLAGVALASAGVASAQMAVHVVAGVVKSTGHGALSVATDNGSNVGQFQLTKPSGPLNFDADLRSGTAAPDAFDKVGESVLLYYTGFDDQRTAVAVRDLGAKEYTKTTGTVTAYDKKTRTVTVKDDGGKTLTLTLDPNLVLDTDVGVQNGKKFSPHKGDHVRVVYGGATQNDVVLLGEMI